MTQPQSRSMESVARDDEKIEAAMHVDHQPEWSEDQMLVENYSDVDRRKLLRKMDLHLLPWLTLLYLFAFIDRSNIGNANIEGMSEDLGLSGTQYNVVLSIFFVTYIPFQMPSNYVLGRYFCQRPSWWLGFIATIWGIFMIAHGLVNNYAGIISVRLAMGIFEAGLFPGAITLLNKWYTKYELAERFALFYVGSAIAGAFSGLLAYAFAKLDGVAGYEGWRWIFILEGVITAVLGLLVPWFLADTPSKATFWLTDEQRRYLTTRMTIQEGGNKAQEAGSQFSWSVLWDIVTDWQFHVIIFNYWSNSLPTYGIKFFLPQILANMGYTSSHAQLLTIPPYVAGAISAYTMGRLGDKFRRRPFFVMGPQLVVITGYAIITGLAPRIQTAVGAIYFAIILLNIGLYPINPGTTSWISNNLPGSAKRTIGIAYLTTVDNFAGIAASYIFIAREAPSYPTGFGTSLAFATAGFVASIALLFIYTAINKKRAAMSETEIREKYTEEELGAMGNRSPLFVYTT